MMNLHERLIGIAARKLRLAFPEELTDSEMLVAEVCYRAGILAERKRWNAGVKHGKLELTLAPKRGRRKAKR